MNILIDMNLSPLWVPYLQKYDFEAQHWSTLGKPDAPDTVLFNWAKDNKAVIFTNDLDFGAILAASQTNAPSVFQVRTQDLLPASIGQIVVDSLRRFTPELEAGALITLDLNRTKVRILPI